MSNTTEGYVQDVDVIRVEKLPGKQRKKTRYRLHTKDHGLLLSKDGLTVGPMSPQLTGKESGRARVALDFSDQLIGWRFL